MIEHITGLGVMFGKDIIEYVSASSLATHCSFDKINKIYRDNMLRMNVTIHDIRCNNLRRTVDLHDPEFDLNSKTLSEFENIYNISCNSAFTDGVSKNYSEERHEYSYVAEMDYVRNYVKDLPSNEKAGVNSTHKFSYNNNGPYGDVINLYHDDNHVLPNTSTKRDTERVNAPNCESILKKTKDLFNQRKINSIISRFHTTGVTNDNLSSVTDKANMSHGRNLLLKSVEKGSLNDGYLINGYQNPYCRVWTHHYKYDMIGKTMRPFVQMNTEGEPVSLTNHLDFHNWKSFNDKKNALGWKNGGINSPWKYSVFNKNNGLVQITPQYGGVDHADKDKRQVHTRQCMFSIENLAWKDYDPYSFEEALSWEQRGPNGGRIMWFPPYDLTFTESSQTYWKTHDFIGRGEQVYTYANTKRSGTLSFTMLIDHPSILDYLTSLDNPNADNDNIVSDTDILRFFAGCDTGNSNSEGNPNGSNGSYSLLNYVKPTTLDDELGTPENIVIKPEQKITEPVKETPKEEPEINNEDDLLNISFCAFYPNNYSGFYDREENRNVEPIAYLLNGIGANVTFNETNMENTQDIECKFNNLKEGGYGYELFTKEGISKGQTELKNNKNYLPCISPEQRKTKTKQILLKGKNKVGPYYYRVDYTYKPYKTNNEHKFNTINQRLANKDYSDTTTEGLNFSVDTFKTKLKQFIGNENVFSLFEMAVALATISDYKETLKRLYAMCGEDLSKRPSQEVIDEKNSLIGRVYYLVDIFTMYKLKAIDGYGFSNSHGRNASKSLNSDRNKKLADERYKTLANWVKQHSAGKWSNVEDKLVDAKSSVDVGKQSTHNVNTKEAKIYRSATCTLRFEKVVQKQDMNDTNKTGEGWNSLIQGSNVDVTDMNLTTPDIETAGNHTPPGGVDTNETLVEVNKYALTSEQYDEVSDTKEKLIEIAELVRSEILKHFEVDGYRSVNKLGNVVIQHNTSDNLLCFIGNLNTKTDFAFPQNIHDKVEEFNLLIDKLYINKIIDQKPLIDLRIIKVVTAPYSSDEVKSLLPDNFEGLYKALKDYIPDDDDNVRYLVIPNGNLRQYVSNNFNNYFDYEQDSDKTANITQRLTLSKNKKGKNNEDLYYDTDLFKNETKETIYYIKKEDGFFVEYIEEVSKVIVSANNNTLKIAKRSEFLLNKVRYDQEYRFFRELELKSPTLYRKIKDRIKIFDSTFHSMSPEGFNARLNFLEQCTRQGFTRTRSDINGGIATNVAFGRPPFCILRIGDFYNQMIAIHSINKDYGVDGQVNWDLNVEGAGVQPMMVKVSINFDFIGGSDLSGAIYRLQNANTFNYYANTSLYDNRADRRYFNVKQKGEIDQILTERIKDRYSYVTEISKK